MHKILNTINYLINEMVHHFYLHCSTLVTFSTPSGISSASPTSRAESRVTPDNLEWNKQEWFKLVSKRGARNVFLKNKIKKKKCYSCLFDYIRRLE
jgi:hypothetical protein